MTESARNGQATAHGAAPAGPGKPLSPELERVAQAAAQWAQRTPARAKVERDDLFETISGDPVKALYTPVDLAGFDYERDLGFPGEYPYTRGIRHSMYRGRLWTMRQFAGFGTREGHQRALPLPAGARAGRAVDRVRRAVAHGLRLATTRARSARSACAASRWTRWPTWRRCSTGIDLAKVTTSMTINGPAAIIWGLFLANAEKQGVGARPARRHAAERLLQGVHRAEVLVLPAAPRACGSSSTRSSSRPSTCRSGTSISVSGYHIREAGSTAAQELAFTLKDGFTYVEECIKRRLDVDAFAPRLSFFFNAHLDFFEEIAKLPRGAPHLGAAHARAVQGEEARSRG